TSKTGASAEKEPERDSGGKGAIGPGEEERRGAIGRSEESRSAIGPGGDKKGAIGPGEEERRGAIARADESRRFAGRASAGGTSQTGAGALGAGVTTRIAGGMGEAETPGGARYRASMGGQGL